MISGAERNEVDYRKDLFSQKLFLQLTDKVLVYNLREDICPSIICWCPNPKRWWTVWFLTGAWSSGCSTCVRESSARFVAKMIKSRMDYNLTRTFRLVQLRTAIYLGSFSHYIGQDSLATVSCNITDLNKIQICAAWGRLILRLGCEKCTLANHNRLFKTWQTSVSWEWYAVAWTVAVSVHRRLPSLQSDHFSLPISPHLRQFQCHQFLLMVSSFLGRSQFGNQLAVSIQTCNQCSLPPRKMIDRKILLWFWG